MSALSLTPCKENREAAKAAQLLTCKFKNANKDLRFKTKPVGTWLELSKVISRVKPIGNYELKLIEENIKKDFIGENTSRNNMPSLVSPPTTPRSLMAEQAFVNTAPQKYDRSVAMVDYPNQLHNICASSTPSLDMLRIVLSTSPQLAKRKNKDGDLPLHVVLNTQEDPSALVVIELLQVYPESAKVKTADGFMPLFLACKKPKIHPSVIKAILYAHSQATSVKQFGSSSLHALTYTGSGNVEAIKYLLTIDPSLAQFQNHFGNLPLHYLVVNNHNASSVTAGESIRQLVSAHPPGVLVKNKSGESPLSRMTTRWMNGQNSMNKVDDEKVDDNISLQQMFYTDSLRYMLRAVNSSLLTIQEKKLLKDLNWIIRRDVIMSVSFVSHNKYINPAFSSSVDFAISDDSSRTSTDSLSDAQMFANVIVRINCGEIKQHIFSYL